MKTALYARVSTDDKGQDAEMQLRELRTYCERSNFEVFSEYVDQASGSGRAERPNFDKMMEDARLKRFDMLLVWKFDRFSREGSFAAINYIKLLGDYGVIFRSLTEPFLDTSGFGKEVLIPLMAWMAKQESIKISERVTSGLAKRKAEGKALGRANLMSLEMRSQLTQQILDEHARGKSIRAIHATYRTKSGKVRRASIGFVHMTIKKFQEGKDLIKPSISETS